jgi:hypothetical protein
MWEEEISNLIGLVQQTVNDRPREHQNYIAKKLEVGHKYDKLRTNLQELQFAGNIPNAEKIPTFSRPFGYNYATP